MIIAVLFTSASGTENVPPIFGCIDGIHDHGELNTEFKLKVVAPLITIPSIVY
jgi:hypothetical protein